jgi:hypothetical protein
MTPDSTCANCGKKSKDHLLVNYADGPHVGISVLICPAATFREPTNLDKPVPYDTSRVKR